VFLESSSKKHIARMRKVNHRRHQQIVAGIQYPQLEAAALTPDAMKRNILTDLQCGDG